MSTYTTAADVRRHFANCHAYFDGFHLVGDDKGYLYRLNESSFLDGRCRIVREIHLTAIRGNKRRIRYGSLELDIQTGLGEANTDYTMELSTSDDGGKTYNNSRSRSIGKGGEYSRHVEWWRLGSSEARTFKLTTSAQCPLKIRGGWLNAR
jgi:hypothetical protein